MTGHLFRVATILAAIAAAATLIAATSGCAAPAAVQQAQDLQVEAFSTYAANTARIHATWSNLYARTRQVATDQATAATVAAVDKIAVDGRISAEAAKVLVDEIQRHTQTAEIQTRSIQNQMDAAANGNLAELDKGLRLAVKIRAWLVAGPSIDDVSNLMNATIAAFSQPLPDPQPATAPGAPGAPRRRRRRRRNTFDVAAPTPDGQRPAHAQGPQPTAAAAAPAETEAYAIRKAANESFNALTASFTASSDEILAMRSVLNTLPDDRVFALISALDVEIRNRQTLAIVLATMQRIMQQIPGLLAVS